MVQDLATRVPAMPPRPSWIALSLLLPLAGCAELAAGMCHGDAQRAGSYLGTRYAGTSCTSSPGYVRKGRVYPGSSSCSPSFRPVYQWNETSERVYAACMAVVAARYGRRAG
jgi:hypothetical protein